jgi:hypothetical protein
MSMAVDGGTSVATQIGGSLADAAISQLGGIAIGQLMSVAGWDPSGQSAITGQLNTIISMLSALETAVTGLATDMEKTVARADYDTLAQTAETLTAANLAIARRLKDYAAASAGDRPEIEADVKQLMEEARIDQAPEIWHSTLYGDNGSTGLLAAWNRLVRDNHAIFGPDASKALQQHWEHVDGQQALGVAHCVELINAGDTSADAKKGAVQAIYDSWRTNRTLQLSQLRGMMFITDDMDFVVDGAKQTVTTPVNALPESTTIISMNGQLVMCYLTLRGPVSRGSDLTAFRTTVSIYAYDAGMFTDVGWDDALVNGKPGPFSWNLQSRDEMPGLLQTLGGSVGQDQDHFADALKAQGFNFPDGQLRLWGDGTVLPPMPIPMPQEWTGVVFVEGDSWWNPSTDPDDSAMVLLARPVPDAETSRYWYPN